MSGIRGQTICDSHETISVMLGIGGRGGQSHDHASFLFFLTRDVLLLLVRISATPSKQRCSLQDMLTACGRLTSIEYDDLLPRQWMWKRKGLIGSESVLVVGRRRRLKAFHSAIQEDPRPLFAAVLAAHRIV